MKASSEVGDERKESFAAASFGRKASRRASKGDGLTTFVRGAPSGSVTVSICLRD